MTTARFSAWAVSSATPPIMASWLHVRYSMASGRGGPFQSISKQILLDGNQPLCQSENETVVNQERNRLYLVRLDGYGEAFDADGDHDGAVSCADLVAADEELAEAYGVIFDEPDNAYCE